MDKFHIAYVVAVTESKGCAVLVTKLLERRTNGSTPTCSVWL